MEKKTFTQFCKEYGYSATRNRIRAFEILAKAGQPMGAYEVLLGMQGAGPPTAYRALDFLVAHGFAHKIEGKYIICAFDTPHDNCWFRICGRCGKVTEEPCRDDAVYGLSRGLCAECLGSK